jgi:carbamate kinase
MAKRLVIALGGNALGNSPEEQLLLVKNTAGTIVDLVEEGYDVVVGHGNGPQVGMVNLAMDYSSNNGGNTPYIPFPECGAMTQGYIGYHLQQAIGRELNKRHINKPVASVITQTIVDRNDAAFSHPTKPVGSFYTKEQADAIAADKGWTFVEDAGRGYRRVVPSPIPQKIVELPMIEQLVESGNVVISTGGGGIPVVEEDDGCTGVAAVIDKDRASSLLARELHADMLVILTAVEKVAIHFNTPEQENLEDLTLEQCQKYADDGEFAPGSMLPKIESCMSFVENTENGTALITSLEKAKEALEGKTGTRIHR